MEGFLTDEQWALILPLLLPQKPKGRKRADDRQTLEGILWVLKTGSRWQDLPREYGSKTRCHRRLKEWQEEGVWERVWRAFLTTLDEIEKAGLDFPETFVPAKKGESRTHQEGSKVMLVVEGLPIGVLVESAQRSDLAEATLTTVKVPRCVGRPKIRPKEVRAIESDTLRRKLRARGSSLAFLGGGTPCPDEGRSRISMATGRDGRWREPLPGFLTSGGL
ncbi:IS5 family transposase [Dehalococcoidia bacterium]|nr:IS5 family transposase [Dehalococcoidia bacterium]